MKYFEDIYVTNNKESDNKKQETFSSLTQYLK
jgi:hypothetical protein